MLLKNIDDIPAREIIDDNNNKHKLALIEFLQECRLCVLNGRGDVNDNNYTSISIKGTAVVAYNLVPINNISMFSQFKVQSCMEVILKLNL